MILESKGEPAVPVLVKCLKDPDAKVRDNTASALWRIGEDPNLVVPALVESLNDTDHDVRETAADALGGFGDRAKPAVPQILKLIKEKKSDDPDVERLYFALHNIDPAAAAKLRGK